VGAPRGKSVRREASSPLSEKIKRTETNGTIAGRQGKEAGGNDSGGKRKERVKKRHNGQRGALQ